MKSDCCAVDEPAKLTPEQVKAIRWPSELEVSDWFLEAERQDLFL